MKSRSRILAVFALAVALWMACDARDPTDAGLDFDSTGDADADHRLDASNRESAGPDGLRARADAAFEETTRTPERFETRIGPQPWPRDLPANWPRPERARVVADSRRAEGDRLLLLDVPGAADDTFAAYRRALRDEHFEVDEVATAESESRRGLRVRRGTDRATLRFFDRDRRTRVEILFLGPDPAADS